MTTLSVHQRRIGTPGPLAVRILPVPPLEPRVTRSCTRRASSRHHATRRFCRFGYRVRQTPKASGGPVESGQIQRRGAQCPRGRRRWSWSPAARWRRRRPHRAAVR